MKAQHSSIAPELSRLLAALFPRGHQIQQAGLCLVGTAETAAGKVSVLGSTEAAAIDHALALQLAEGVLATIAEHPQRPIVFLVDTSGQVLSRHAELLCLNASFAHLACCVDLARRQGHPTLALVLANAVSGGFLSFGLMADNAFALAGTEVRVMDLKAMARVTKIAFERLQSLATSSPIFAPGPENFLRMGALTAIWDGPQPECLDAALLALQAHYKNNADAPHPDQRQQQGCDRGGRLLAAQISADVLKA